ncbi:hypothetical protein AB835_00930 [Candidatus Endobugula sertula]|uniref:Inner membrane protein n=1 Tax=Candidatus Endobugula sertula TaxID=62101 RepID=A0A1D2QTJ4_9GAMM|nr:hypothetical protein AB835_00930 [Candidatus Endobugula sertula]
MTNLLYKIIGLLSLALGTLGAFLPILPTTVFVLIAAWCFAKSSPRLYQWLLNNHLFGPIIQQWEIHHCIPPRICLMIIAMVLIFGTISLMLLESLALKILLVVLLTVGIYNVHSFKRQPAKVKTTHHKP